ASSFGAAFSKGLGVGVEGVVGAGAAAGVEAGVDSDLMVVASSLAPIMTPRSIAACARPMAVNKSFSCASDSWSCRSSTVSPLITSQGCAKAPSPLNVRLFFQSFVMLFLVSSGLGQGGQSGSPCPYDAKGLLQWSQGLLTRLPRYCLVPPARHTRPQIPLAGCCRLGLHRIRSTS